MTDTVGSWAARAAQLPAVMVRATGPAVTAGAQALEAAARVNLLADSGGDGVLSRVRSGKGARVGVKLDTSGSGSKTVARVLPVGPVSLLESDTRRHTEPFQYVSQRTGGARTYSMARRRKAARNSRGLIYVPGLGMFQGVKHPGTRGKRPMGRAFDSHHDDAGRKGLDVYADAITRHLRD